MAFNDSVNRFETIGGNFMGLALGDFSNIDMLYSRNNLLCNSDYRYCHITIGDLIIKSVGVMQDDKGYDSLENSRGL